MADPESTDEVVVDDNFAKRTASAGGAIRKRNLELLAPHFLLSSSIRSARDIMPDHRRFGVIWMPEKALASAYNLKNAFSSVVVKLLPTASEPEVIRRIDQIVERFGVAPPMAVRTRPRMHG